MINNQKIGIIGGGAVGQAIAAYYSGALIYDKYKPSANLDEVAQSDFIFVAVPTPFQGQPDLNEMDEAIESLVKHMPRPNSQVILLKSTMVPGTTYRYQKLYPQANFIFNPEFLTEKTAVADFAKPDKQLVGYTSKTEQITQSVLDILPVAPYQTILPALDAEIIKYAINAFYAFKVIFANQIYDLCKKLGIDYNAVREGLVADHRIVDSHFEVEHGGYRGYQGKCLPKDLQTLIWVANQHNVEVKFLEQIHQINKSLIQPS